jgi:hypothetical protein
MSSGSLSGNKKTSFLAEVAAKIQQGGMEGRFAELGPPYKSNWL